MPQRSATSTAAQATRRAEVSAGLQRTASQGFGDPFHLPRLALDVTTNGWQSLRSALHVQISHWEPSRSYNPYRGVRVQGQRGDAPPSRRPWMGCSRPCPPVLLAWDGGSLHKQHELPNRS
ncbi:hypothetical protein VTN96DRAFT_380 [Rasamsonia emersonii]